ncbi:MAG: HEAT repeat domain-containing protein [Sedimentisphaerales bacterium]
MHLNQRKSTRALTAYTLTVCAVLIFGCHESLQKTYAPPRGGFVEDLAPQATRIVLAGLTDDDPQIRANAVEAIATTKQIKLMPKVQRLLQDDFIPVRFAAALAVGDCEYSLAENSLKQLLEDEDENVRIAADYAMNKLGSSSGFELVRKALTSNNQTIRANAAFLLGKSGDKSSLKLLWWVLQHKDSDYKAKFNAAEAIARLGDERIDEKLLAVLISTYADDRIVGIKAMGALGTEKAKSFLMTKLDDDVLEVRLAAAEQLGMLGDTTGEREVQEVFTKNLTAGLDKESLERINTLTALAIGQIGTASLTRFLPPFFKNESKFVRIAAAKAVFQCTMKH